jgi:predicted Zn-dependent protease
VAASVLPFSVQAADAPGSIAVQWSEAGSRGNFGLANLGQRTLSLGPAAFHLLRSRNPNYDASSTLQMVISHEMGHFYGLMAHSRHCADVTSYYDNGQGEKCFTRDAAQMKNFVEYRSELPTACDLQRCRIANGSKSGPAAR